MLGSVGMFGFAFILGDTRYLIMAGILAVAMLASGVASRVAHTRSARRSHEQRTVRYREVLSQLRSRLETGESAQRRCALYTYPDDWDLWSVVVDRRRVWERRPHHDDFLTVRIGTGGVPAAAAPRRGRSADPLTEPDPDLDREAEELEARFGSVSGQPITLDLGPIGCLAIAGDPDRVRATTRSIVTQLAVFRSPDDLRLVVAHTPETALDWSWAKHLPHTHADGGNLVTADIDDLATVLHQIAKPRLAHLEQATITSPVSLQRVMVVLDDYDPDGEAGRNETIEELLPRGRDIGVTFVCGVSDPTRVPSIADVTMSITGQELTVTSDAPDDERITAAPPLPPLDLTAQIARVIAPLRLRARTGRATTIDSAGLLELLEIGFPYEVDTLRLRRDAGPLQTPIGITGDGSPVMLDLRESSSGGMGPHGMLIGATGSGKSELLRTLVLGLAARNAPEDLAFVLVDYKGGATFSKLDRLPHTAGMITNLERDPSLTDRMLDALHGELERRQRVLHDAGGFDRADEYRAHRRAHSEAGLDPLPALLLVVDEFSELLAAKPEFGDLFSTIGRVGRSLGVHLLASTQRLEDGRIRKLEGHLRYRLCLRTFTPEESMSVIGSKAAAELPPIPGVGFLKVDGTMTPFKAGFVNRPLRGSDRSEMEHVVAALEAVGDAPARPVWLAPLPDSIRLHSSDQVDPTSTGWLTVEVGVEDDPRRQRQSPYTLDFSGARGNLAVLGGPRSGKSSMLQTLVGALALTHSPHHVQIYGIDFAGGGLHMLEDLPHVGAVLSRSHKQEIAKLLRRLRRLLEERAGLFRDHRLTSMNEFHRLRDSGVISDELGEVFVVIDNWGAMCTELTADQMEVVTEVFSTGLHHGVHLVTATPRYQDIKLGMRDAISGRFEFRLTDPIDSEIDRTLSRSLPTDVPGRGIGHDARIVQVSLPRLESGGFDDIAAMCRVRWPDAPSAPPVRVLPTVVRSSELTPTELPSIGIEEHRLSPHTFDLFGTDPHLLVFGDSESGKTNALAQIIQSMTQAYTADQLQIAVVDYRRRLAGAVPESHRLGFAATPESAAVIASRVGTDLSGRLLPDDVSVLRHAGPALVVVVDDYDLVAGAAGNPLSPLVDHVAQGRDLGLHLVLARRVGGATRSSFEPLFQRVREVGTPGLILSGDPGEGPLIGGVKATIRPPGRGTWVGRGRVTEVQVALCDPIPPVADRPLHGAAL